MTRQVDAQLVATVRAFRRRPRWRHILALIAGAVLLIAGSGFLAARLTHHALASTPPLGVAVGLYAAGVLLFAWGAAGGFTVRLAWWLPLSAVLGLVAGLVFALSASFSNEANSAFYDGRGSSSTKAGRGRSRAPGTALQGDGDGDVTARASLAAELLDRDDVARYLGPGVPDLQTPGVTIARSHSVAIWRAVPPGPIGVANARPRGIGQAPMLSLAVQLSPRRAAGFSGGAQVSVHNGVGGPLTRAHGGRGDWVVTLQLRHVDPAAGDPGPALAADAEHVLGLLNAVPTAR